MLSAFVGRRQQQAVAADAFFFLTTSRTPGGGHNIPHKAGNSKRSIVCYGAVFRGKGLPYVETFEEQQLRRLWETDPFKTCRMAVAHILLSSTAGEEEESPPPPLRVLSTSPAPESPYENMFDIFYSSKPAGTSSDEGADDGFEKKETANFFDPKDKKLHFRITFGYQGERFCGWQRQPRRDIPSVQQVLEDSLIPLDPAELQPKSKKKKNYVPKPPNVRVAGRTDAGVSAVGQVGRFRTFDTNVTAKMVQKRINESAALQQGGIYCLGAQQVGRTFHPQFDATCRAYMYLIDWEEGDPSEEVPNAYVIQERLNLQLQSLVNHDLDYIALSYGKLKTENSNCILYHAKAKVVESPCSEDASNKNNMNKTAIAIELVGNRFLRRMVRLLVATALRVAYSRSKSESSISPTALLELINTRDRLAIYKPAPPTGLIFVGARFHQVDNM